MIIIKQEKTTILPLTPIYLGILLYITIHTHIITPQRRSQNNQKMKNNKFKKIV